MIDLLDLHRNEMQQIVQQISSDAVLVFTTVLMISSEGLGVGPSLGHRLISTVFEQTVGTCVRVSR